MMSMSPVVSVVAVVLLVLLVVQAWRPRRPWPQHPFPVGSPEADASTLETLRRTGADLTKEIEVHFRLYFPTRDAAGLAGELSRQGGCVTSVERSPDGKEWLCLVAARLLPTEMEIRDFSIRMGAVAATTGGRYDGWEAAGIAERENGADGTSHREPSGSGRAGAGSFPVVPGRINLFIKWLVALVGYVNGPIRVFRTQRIGPAVDVTPISAEDERAMPEELRAYLTRVEQGLSERGFGVATRAIVRPLGAVTAYASLLENTDHATLASAIVTRTVRGNTMATTIFRSDFGNGEVLISSNDLRRRRLPRQRGYAVVRFPGIEPTALYDVHRFRAAEYARVAPMQKMTRHPDPLTYQVRETAESHERWIEAGYFRRAADGGLRPTRRGAVCVVWRGKFPWLQLTRWRDRRARAAVMARYRPH
jgi:hypothetical protein